MWMSKEEKKQLVAQAHRHGFTSVTEFVKAVARGAVKVSPEIKALAVSAMGVGVEQSGCGLMTLLVLASPVALWLLF